MILPPTLARAFIHTYQALLESTTKMLDPEAYENATTSEDNMLNLHSAREAMMGGKVSFDEVLSRTRDDGVLLDDEALGAIRRLRLERWIFLRDTRGGSIILDTDTPTSFLVLGLTEPLREVTGQRSILIRTGIAPLRNVFFCDGLVGTYTYIGPNRRRELNERQQRQREQGTYFKRYDENMPHFPILR